MTDPTPLERDYTLVEVADALRKSTRWVREQIKAGNVEHLRPGHKITFTAEQVAAFRKSLTHQPAEIEQSITTGAKRKQAS